MSGHRRRRARSAPTSRSARSSSVGAGASIGDRTVVYPNVTIGPGARIGDDCVIHANVSIRERVTLGHRVVLQDGVVLGGDGYGFVRRARRHAREDSAGRRPSSSRTTSRSAPTPRWIVRRSARRASRPARRSTTWCRSPTASTVGRNALMAAQVGISGSTDHRRRRDLRRPGRRRRPPDASATAPWRSGSRVSPTRSIPARAWPAIPRSTIADLAPLVGALQAPARAEETHRRARGRARGARNARARGGSDPMMRTLCLAAAFAAAAGTCHGPVDPARRLSHNTQAPADNPEGAVVLLPRYHFHLNMAHLSNDSPRYNWDTNYGGELDIVAVRADAADVRRQLPGRARRGVSPLRSEPGQLHPRWGAQHAREGRLRGRRLPPPVAPSRRPRRSVRRWTGTCSAAAWARCSRAAAPTSRRGSICSAPS